MVIGVLTAIAIHVYGGIQDRAIENSIRSDLSNSAYSLESYKAENGEYPGIVRDEMRDVLVFSEENYEYNDNNFLYCSNGEEYAIYVTGSDNQRHYQSSTYGYDKNLGIRASNKEACPKLGVDNHSSIWMKGNGEWIPES